MNNKIKYFTMLVIAIINSPFIDLGAWGSMIGLFLLAFFLPKGKFCDQFTTKEIKLFSAIFFICILQSIFFVIFEGMDIKYFSRGLSTSLTSFFVVLFCAKLYNLYKEESFIVVFDGLVLSYSINVIYALAIFGLGPVINSVFAIFSGGLETAGNETDVILEKSHAILLIMPFICDLFLLRYFSNNDKTCLRRMLIAIVISLLAYKRIAIGAAFLVLIVILLRKFYNKSTIILSGVFIISLLLFYVFFIKTGSIYILASQHDVDLAFRDVIWQAIDKFYPFTWDFKGYGWDFITKYLHENNLVLFGNHLGGIHNDILKIYIDFGFIGTIVYFAYFLIYCPLKLNGFEKSFIFWLCQVYLIIIYLTDNAMVYLPCQLIAYLSPFYLNINASKNINDD